MYASIESRAVLSSPGASVVLDTATIRELEPSLIAYARQRVGRADLAEDLVQETWIAAMTSLAGFAGRSTLRTWLISILRRKIVDSFRRQKAHVGFDDAFHGQADGTNETRLDDEDALRVLEAELVGLAEGERRAVTLCDLEGVDREEAARCMGVTRAHLRVLLHRGRLKLRESIEASRCVPLAAFDRRKHGRPSARLGAEVAKTAVRKGSRAARQP